MSAVLARLKLPTRLGPAHPWRMALLRAALLLGLLLLVYAGVVAETVDTWWRSETFAHAFLIAPISVFLMWRKREELARMTPLPDGRGLILLGLLGLVWLAGWAARVLVVQQYAVVGMIAALAWTLFGPRVTRALAFPLGYLFLAVPFGEVLLPTLVHYTADFTVWALQVTGIPVYREGNFLSLPSGNWSVVEACSGLRYLIASFTLGLLYAYLTYRSLARRLLFVAASIAVPIVANWLRAYMIVMIGHLSDMRLAVGVDHILYGWVFFGVVMLLLFWVGSFWREDGLAVPAPARLEPAGTPPRAPARIGLVTGLVLLLGPAYAQVLDWRDAAADYVALPVPVPAEPWQLTDEMLSPWQPRFLHPRTALHQTYRHPGSQGAAPREVALHVFHYQGQQQGAELINSQNVLVSSTDHTWGLVAEAERATQIGGEGRTVIEAEIRSPGDRLLVWYWYRVGGEETVSRYRAKWLEAKARLLGRGDASALVALVARADPDRRAAETRLADFAKAGGAVIAASLRAAGG